MTIDELEVIKKTRKWPFRMSDILSRYFFLIFPLFITLIGISELYSGFKNDLIDLKITSIVIIGFGLLMFYFITIRLYQNKRFNCIKIQNLTTDKIEKAIKETKFKNWTYHKIGYFSCTTKISGFSWGEEITIIPVGENLLVNSRPTGSLFSYQPITIFKDKKNIRMFVEKLKNTSPQTHSQ